VGGLAWYEGLDHRLLRGQVVGLSLICIDINRLSTFDIYIQV